MDASTAARIKQFVKLRCRSSLSYDEKLDILWLEATLREQGNLDVTGAIAHEDARDAYVNMMVPTVTMSPRRPLVYLDESFVHHHYSSYADSQYHTDDPMTKPKHNGRRYCCIAGILDDGSDVAHLLGLDIFVGGKKSGKIVKDYHAMSNHDYFVDWFGKLLDEVEELGWSSAVFVMDNAKYHKGKPKSTPKGSWKKADLYQACLDRSVPMSPYRSQDDDLEGTEEALGRTCPACRCRHGTDPGPSCCVLCPGFPELQPIELLRANARAPLDVRTFRQPHHTFQDVRDLLEKAFYELDTDVIHNTIESFTAKLLKLDRALRDAEVGAADEPMYTDVAANLRIRLSTAAGPVNLPGVQLCYVISRSDSFPVSRYALQSTGININHLLEQVAQDQSHEDGDDVGEPDEDEVNCLRGGDSLFANGEQDLEKLDEEATASLLEKAFETLKIKHVKTRKVKEIVTQVTSDRILTE
ncbi:hypothetical protein DYB38_008667 [Aphanomyces astaci]|uniref:Tc1-like transposase DDE domain-containing protein n=1 Tax=Aphanomyces astaci TaxID=112090 RepID=A0A397D5L5_APHAT|nr:hypothetical protein DYB38_008667 [Aphanomyces astaci]RHZ38285.1 hypothetical protein DYB31_009838 [Aphanomyces astaci]